VAAYDLSGNVGPAAAVNATISPYGVSALAPRRDDHVADVREVRVMFSQPSTSVGLTVRDSQGKPVAGTIEPIKVEVALDEVAIMGVRFVPEGGALASGDYVATVTATAVETGESLTMSWAFTVMEQPSAGPEQ
jgi:hypothetical protein